MAILAAGVFIDDAAVTRESFVERDAVVRQPQRTGEPALAVLDRLGRMSSPFTSSGSNAQSIARCWRHDGKQGSKRGMDCSALRRLRSSRHE